MVYGVWLIGVSGCSEVGPARVEVEGRVVLDGIPIDGAMIVFAPVGEGVSAAGMIVGGRYAIASEMGPSLGEYWVRINPVEPELGASVLAGESHPVSAKRVPDIYQREGALRVRFTEPLKQQFDVELSSKGNIVWRSGGG